MQAFSTILKIAPSIILWFQKGWVAGILALLAAFLLTWVFTIMALSSGSAAAIEKSKFWIGPAVFVVVLGVGQLLF